MSKFIHNETMRTPGNYTNLKKLGVFTLKDALRLGVSQPTISRLVRSGKISRLENGIFHFKGSDIPTDHVDLVVAKQKFGAKSAVGLLTAMIFHGITEIVSEKTWVLVQPEIKTSTGSYRCIRTKSSFTIGIENHKYFKVTNVERTIVEGFRHASKIGLDTAVKAARTALRSKKTSEGKILKMAKALKMEQFVIKHWEAMTVA